MLASASIDPLFLTVKIEMMLFLFDHQVFATILQERVKVLMELTISIQSKVNTKGKSWQEQVAAGKQEIIFAGFFF